MSNSHEKKPETKIKEKRCPFDKSLKCEDCRLFWEFSNALAPMCVLIYTAIRS